MNRRTLVAFIDALFLMLLIFVLLPHQPKAGDDTPPPGTLAVEIRWPDNMNTDVDLWLMSPSERKPVGYSHRAGVVWNLLRDDLGHVRDLDHLNYENGFTRGAPDGEYIVNVHLYSNIQAVYPVPVTVVVTAHLPTGQVNIFDGSVNLSRIGQEVTVVRFSISDERVVSGSTHDIQRPLRRGQF